MKVFGYSASFVLLVAIAIVVGMKFMHDHVQAEGTTAGPTSQPNSANPATAPSSLKY